MFCFLASIVGISFGQVENVSYQQYKDYALGGYLNTTLSNNRVAGVEWQNGDTSSSVRHINEAIKQGLFDSTMITNNSNLKGVTKTSAWKAIKKDIEKNISNISKAEQLKIVSDDVYNFVRLYPSLLQNNGDAVLWKDYIAGGSNGLKTFFNVRMSSRSDFVLGVIKKHRNFYAGIEPVAKQLSSFDKQIKEAAQKIEELYPPSVFPPIYFLVGNLNSAGTPDGGAGQLVGIEFFSNYPGRDTSELNAWEKSVLSDTSRLVGVVVHEMMHVQQKNSSGNTVLEKCITEGAADFLTYLLLGKILLPRQHSYGNAHQKELYDRFMKEKNGTDLSYWMYNVEMEDKGIPSDLGYYIGFKICEGYYAKQKDKNKAIKDILERTDFENFLKESGYEKSFN